MSFLFSRSNSHSTSDTDLSPFPPYTPHTLSTLLASFTTDESGSFVGTVFPPVTLSSGSSSPGYGFLSMYPTLILGIDDLHELVQLVSKYLDVETPFVFSNGATTAEGGASVAIDLDAGRVKRLIDKYVGYLLSKSAKASKSGQVIDFDDEARFAGPHELGMLLRWGLARVVRIETSSSPNPTSPTQTSGNRSLCRGLIPYLAYLNWAKQESVFSYPSTHFGSLLDTRTRISVPVKTRDEFGIEELVWKEDYKEVMPPSLKETLLTLFALLAKLVAHSAKSGATPPGLSPLFGPLLFGLGPLPSDSISSSSLSPSSSTHSPTPTPTTPDPTSFESTYTSYLRSVHATEHCLLSFIRWQDTPSSLGGGGSGTGGVPGRLKEWIKDYPRTLSGHTRVLAIAELLGSGGYRNQEQHSLGPRKGVKTLRVLAVRRTVPVYDRDLVRSSARWGLSSYAAGGLSENGLPRNKEWGRIAPPVQVQQGSGDKGKAGKMSPKYSESYRKRMNIPPGVEPGSSPYAPPLSSLSSSTSSYSSSFSFSSSYASPSSPLTRSTSRTSTYSFTETSSPTSSSPTSPSTSHPSSQSRFRTLTDAHWGAFESSGFLSPPSTSSRGGKDIDSALKFDLTESARKARTARRGRESVNWGDFVNGGFDLGESRSGGANPLSLSTSSSSTSNYGYGYENGGDPSKSYVGADGRLTDVGEFALDTGLDAALQFNFPEFGILHSRKVLGDKDKEGKGERGERERTIAGVSLGKRLKKKEKPLPPFTYDSTPLLLPGSETLIEAAFVDVFTDLVSWGFAELGLGSGSGSSPGSQGELPGGLGLGLLGDLVMGMFNTSHAEPHANAKAVALSRSVSRDNTDDLRDEGDRIEKAKWRNELFRECNWVIVEFKALPSSASHSHSQSSSHDNDPRTSTSLLLFEEYVPREYRAQLGHQLAGIHPSFILNPAYGHYPFNILGTSSPNSPSLFVSSPSPYSQNSITRTRLGSLFSPGASTSTLGLVESGRGKKDRKIKDAKSKKDKKEKKHKSEKAKTGSFFSGSTRTLTSSTSTPYDSRNRSTPTPTPYSHLTHLTQVDLTQRLGESPSPSPLTPTGPNATEVGTAIPRPPKDKSEEFDAMLADGNRGTKVITLNGALHTLSPNTGLGSEDGLIEGGEGYPDVEDVGDLGFRGDLYGGGGVDIHTTHEHDPSSHPLPPVPTNHIPDPSTAHASTFPTADLSPSSQPSSSTPIKNIFRLGPTSTLSPKSSSSTTSKPTSKPKGLKPKTSRRQSRQNLVPAEYHTVEFETRLTGLGLGGESDADADVQAAGGGEVVAENEIDGTMTGDGFLEEAARRRRAARLAERERLRTERRGKRFSLGLGGYKGGDMDDDDEAWVDIVVPGYGAHRGKGAEGDQGQATGDPEEASQEVARVLSAVRGGQPYPGMDDESIFEEGRVVDGAGGAKVNSDSDDVEVQMVPRFGKDPENRRGNGQGHDDQSFVQSYTSGDLDASITSGDYELPDVEDSNFKPLTSSIPKRRLGYFDLHPDRKKASQEMLRQFANQDEVKHDLLNLRQPEAMSSQEANMFAVGGQSDVDEDDDEVEEVEVDEADSEDEDDPRARYAHASDDGHDEAPRDLDKIHAAKTDKARPLPILPPQKNGVTSTLAGASGAPLASLPPRSSSLSPSLSSLVPLTKSTSKPIAPISETPPAKSLSMTNASSTPSKPSVLTSSFGSTSGTPGKTAALIEMYREKEKKGLPSSPVPPLGGPATPSKIPVKSAVGLPSNPRSVSSPTPPAPLAPTPALTLVSLPSSPAAPVPAAKLPTKIVSPIPSLASTVGINSQLHDVDDDEDDEADVNGLDELIPPSKVGLGLGDDAGRASPGRYIHGAPLHNVLEEEEEE